MSTPQPQQQQSNAPLTVAAITAALIALYAAADHMLLSGVGWILRRSNYSMAGRRQIRALSQRVASELEQATGPLIDQLVTAAVEDAGQTIPTQQVTDAAVEAAAAAEQTVEHIVAALPSAPADAEHILTVDERPTFPVEHGNAFITPPPNEPPKPPKSLVPGNWFDSNKERAVQAVRDDLTSELQDVRRRITRLDDDVYKLIAPQYAINLIQGGITPQEAAAGAWKQFVRQGITGFTDKAGRNWALSTYVEMAVRTATMRAYLEATVQSMDMAGVNLATVPHDAHPCPKCFPWQGRVIAIHPDGVHPTMDDARKAGLWHPQCFPGWVPVSAESGIRAADSRWYEGELVVIGTAAGNELSVTPNHPVLTTEGWVAAGSLVVGDHLIRNRADVERVDGVRPDHDLVEAPIGDVFEALRESSAVSSVRMPVTAEQFHGDGFDADVEVVFVDGLLADGRQSGVGENRSDGDLFVGGVRFASLLPLSASDEFSVGAFASSDGLVRGGGDLSTFCDVHRAEVLAHGVAEVGSHSAAEQPRADGGLVDAESFPDLALGEAGSTQLDGFVDSALRACSGRSTGAHDSGLPDDTHDARFTDLHGGRDLAARLACEVSPDDVVTVDRKRFAGHVYNLQTGSAWYAASSIVVHNCGHALIRWDPSIPPPREWSPADNAAYQVTQKQRALELAVRKAKRMIEYGRTAAQRAEGRQDLRDAQKQLRKLSAESGLPRRSYREQPNLRYSK